MRSRPDTTDRARDDGVAFALRAGRRRVEPRRDLGVARGDDAVDARSSRRPRRRPARRASPAQRRARVVLSPCTTRTRTRARARRARAPATTSRRERASERARRRASAPPAARPTNAACDVGARIVERRATSDRAARRERPPDRETNHGARLARLARERARVDDEDRRGRERERQAQNAELPSPASDTTTARTPSAMPTIRRGRRARCESTLAASSELDATARDGTGRSSLSGARRSARRGGHGVGVGLGLRRALVEGVEHRGLELAPGSGPAASAKRDGASGRGLGFVARARARSRCRSRGSGCAADVGSRRERRGRCRLGATRFADARTRRDLRAHDRRRLRGHAPRGAAACERHLDERRLALRRRRSNGSPRRGSRRGPRAADRSALPQPGQSDATTAASWAGSVHRDGRHACLHAAPSQAQRCKVGRTPPSRATSRGLRGPSSRRPRPRRARPR